MSLQQVLQLKVSLDLPKVVKLFGIKLEHVRSVHIWHNYSIQPFCKFYKIFHSGCMDIWLPFISAHSLNTTEMQKVNTNNIQGSWKMYARNSQVLSKDATTWRGRGWTSTEPLGHAAAYSSFATFDFIASESSNLVCLNGLEINETKYGVLWRMKKGFGFSAPQLGHEIEKWCMIMD